MIFADRAGTSLIHRGLTNPSGPAMSSGLVPPGPRTIAFVLLTYRPDEPAGTGRAVAATAAGLRALGHRAIILTAAPQPSAAPDVIQLTELPVTFPCDGYALRQATDAASLRITRELASVLDHHGADTVIYADALWGLGRLAGQVPHPATPVLAVHATGHRRHLAPALAAARHVIAPSAAAIAEAHRRGYDTSGWIIVPSPLLVDPDDIPIAGPVRRDALRRRGPVRVVARLSAEKGIASLLRAIPTLERDLQIALAPAWSEAAPGSQHAHLLACQALARRAGADIRPPLPWHQVPSFLAGAALTVIASRRETFSNVALESLSAGTPVVGYAVGNLPDLLSSRGGVTVPVTSGPRGLWRAAGELLDNPAPYHQACTAAYGQARNYRSADIAGMLLQAVPS
jgi:iron(II)-dependent oxidoreductase